MKSIPVSVRVAWAGCIVLATCGWTVRSMPTPGKPFLSSPMPIRKPSAACSSVTKPPLTTPTAELSGCSKELQGDFFGRLPLAPPASPAQEEVEIVRQEQEVSNQADLGARR
jgi:hypothetical protein